MHPIKDFFISPDSGERLSYSDDGQLHSATGEVFSVENDIPVLIPEKSRNAYYENVYRLNFKYYPVFDTAFVSQLVAKLDFQKDALMLDLGGGEGFYADCFSKHGIKVISTDFSKYLLEKGKTKYPDLLFAAVDANRIPFQDGTFDFIFCSGLSLFNTPDLLTKKELVLHFMSKLKTGGQLIFSYSTNLTGRKNGTWYPITKSDLDRLFSEQNITHRWFIPRLFVTNILGPLSFSKASSWIFGTIIKCLSVFHRKIRGRLIYVVKK